MRLNEMKASAAAVGIKLPQGPQPAVAVMSPARAAVAVPIAIPMPRSSRAVDCGRIARQIRNPPSACQAMSKVRRTEVSGGTPVNERMTARKALGASA